MIGLSDISAVQGPDLSRSIYGRPINLCHTYVSLVLSDHDAEMTSRMRLNCLSDTAIAQLVGGASSLCSVILDSIHKWRRSHARQWGLNGDGMGVRKGW